MTFFFMIQVIHFELIAPDAWLIRPKKSIFDLDNIKLSKIKNSDIDASFELESILLQGIIFNLSNLAQ